MSPFREKTTYWICLLLTIITIAVVLAIEELREMPWLFMALLLLSAAGFLAGYIEGLRKARGIDEPI